MTLKAFQPPQFSASTLAALVRQATQLVSALVAFFKPLQANPMLDSLRVGQVSLTGGVDVAVTHKLGRQPIDWLLTDITAAATVFRVSWTASTITLHASNTCKVNLWVW